MRTFKLLLLMIVYCMNAMVGAVLCDVVFCHYQLTRIDAIVMIVCWTVSFLGNAGFLHLMTKKNKEISEKTED